MQYYNVAHQLFAISAKHVLQHRIKICLQLEMLHNALTIHAPDVACDQTLT